MAKPLASRPLHSIKLTPGAKTRYLNTFAELQVHYGILAEIWSQMPRCQQEEVLAHSPVLAGYVALFGSFGLRETT